MIEYTLVTGATSDIGTQICHTLVADGYRLLLTDLSEESLAALLASLDGNGHQMLVLDLSNVEDSKICLAAFMAERQIAVRNVVFAAGIFAVKPVKLIDYALLKKNFDIAVFSLLMLTQVLTSKRTNGANLKNVVMISSVSAFMGTKGYVVYGAVKASMLGIMKSLATELAPRVRVNAVLPGGIRTKSTSFLFEGQDEPNPRYLLGDGCPSDISNVISFLLSDKARWITGQQIVVDGGLTTS